MLVATGESSPNVFSRLAPVRTTGQASQRDHRCGASCPGRASWPALDDHVYAPTRKSALLNTLGIAPKLRQNRIKCSSLRFKCNSLLYLNRGLPGSAVYGLSTVRHLG